MAVKDEDTKGRYIVHTTQAHAADLMCEQGLHRSLLKMIKQLV